MTPLETQCLDAFPTWLKSLGDDARQLAAMVENTELSPGARRSAATAVNYLFKSLDLIPDGLEGLGYIDDAFVFRAVAARVAPADAASDSSGTLGRLAGEAALIREFLAEIAPRFEEYSAGLEKTTARGRSVEQVLEGGAARSDWLREVREWAERYQAPAFERDEKNLIKLRSFLAARLK